MFIKLSNFRARGFAGKDHHKKDQKVAEMGGIVVVFSTVSGILAYVPFDTFYYHNLDPIKDVLQWWRAYLSQP